MTAEADIIRTHYVPTVTEVIVPTAPNPAKYYAPIAKQFGKESGDYSRHNPSTVERVVEGAVLAALITYGRVPVVEDPTLNGSNGNGAVPQGEQLNGAS